jgi:hypothetical protein
MTTVMAQKSRAKETTFTDYKKKHQGNLGPTESLTANATAFTEQEFRAFTSTHMCNKYVHQSAY